MGSPAVVYNANLSALQMSDGVVVDIESPSTGQLAPASIAGVAFAGVATWGAFNTRLAIGDPQQQLATIGQQTVSPYDLATFVALALNCGITDIDVVRVGDGSQTAGILDIAGATHPIAVLTGLYPGSRINGATAVLTYSANTPAAQQHTSGNTQKVYVDLTINIPNSLPEVYRNLDGNVFSTTYSLDGPTMGAAIIAAVNNGQANGRGPSAYFVASAGQSTPGAPVMATPNPIMTAGTDGATFSGSPSVTLDQAMLGSNSSLPYTGMWALAGGISGKTFALIGCTDLSTVAASALAFAKAQNAHYCLCAPSNSTSTTTNLALKAGLPFGDWSATFMDGNWPSITDTVNGAITRYVDSGAMAAIRIAMTSLPNSPANQNMPFITGTQRVNSQSQPSPYTDGETIQLENAGLNYWSDETAGAAGWAIGHNKNSLGKVAQPSYTGNITYGRTLQFAAKSFQNPLFGQMVGLAQGFTSSDDSVRKNATLLANGFLSDQMNAGVFDGGCTAVCDLSNNTPGKGMLRIDVQINQKEVIDIVAVGVLSGLNVAVAINPAQVSGSPT